MAKRYRTKKSSDRKYFRRTARKGSQGQIGVTVRRGGIQM